MGDSSIISPVKKYIQFVDCDAGLLSNKLYANNLARKSYTKLSLLAPLPPSINSFVTSITVIDREAGMYFCNLAANAKTITSPLIPTLNCYFKVNYCQIQTPV